MQSGANIWIFIVVVFLTVFQMLRSALDSQGYAHVKIVAPDSASWQFVDDFLKDPELAQAVDIIGQV